MTPSKAAGIIFGIFAAITYGMNPFFGIPLYEEGMTPLSVLFYRFSFAAVLMGGVLLIKKESFRLPLRCLLHTAAAGILLGLTCLFWFLTFRIMDSGIAATILFVYPVMVALIMFFFYRERLTLSTLGGMLMAIAGVVILCQPGSGSKVNIEGLIYILLSALTYAIYIVGVKQSRLRELAPGTLTFYALLFSIPVFLVPLRFGADLQMLSSCKMIVNAVGLALFPSLCAFLFTALAVHRIGPTQTSVMGALEPVTAVTIGVFFFHENMTWKLILGIAIILAAVTFVICGNAKPHSKETKKIPEKLRETEKNANDPQDVIKSAVSSQQ